MKKILVSMLAVLGLALVPCDLVLAATIDRDSSEFKDMVTDTTWFDACAAGRNLTSDACKSYRKFCQKYYSMNYDECGTYSNRYNSEGRAWKNVEEEEEPTPNEYTPAAPNNNAKQGSGSNAVQTTFFGSVDPEGGAGIFAILNLVLRILTYGVGIAATIGFVIAGLQYLTAQDDAGQVAKAKQRMLQIVIGLFLYTMIWAVLNWLLPGGVLNGGS